MCLFYFRRRNERVFHSITTSCIKMFRCIQFSIQFTRTLDRRLKLLKRNTLLLRLQGCTQKGKRKFISSVRDFFSCYHRSRSIIILALFNPPRPNPGRREKIKLNFYFHTSMWCLKKLKPFGAPQEIKFNLLFISIQLFRNARGGKG